MSARRQFGRFVFETSNEDKLLFEKDGITKGRVIEYYERIADGMLPYLRRRPLTMRRCPDGIEDDCFFQKQIGRHFPEWIDRVEVAKGDGEKQTQVVVSNRATLAYLANQAVIPMHVWLSRVDRLDRPDSLVFDLDPPGDDFSAVRRAAKWCRELLDELGLNVFLKTTGSRGLHLTVPLDRSADFDTVRGFAREATELLARRHADELTTEVRKRKRRGRIYLDIGRNAYAQTVVAPYSLRARPGATVAAPITWDELEDRDLGPQTWNIDNVMERIGADPWSGLFRRATSLGPAGRRLRRITEQDGVDIASSEATTPRGYGS